jgi:hypothetical protein
MQQDVGAWHGSAGTEEYGQEEDGDKPTLHHHSILRWSSTWQSSRGRRRPGG